MKKLVALLLCVAMMFAFATPATKTVEEEVISVCGLLFDDEDEVYNPSLGKPSV